jgi:uncharacterized membrane protein
MDAHQRVEELNQLEALDPLVASLDARVPDRLREGPVRDALAGNAIGHALHPMLTDIPIGTWTSATLLDVFGGRRWRGASATLTGIGLLAYVPTVASGLVEWGETPPSQRRVAVLHAGSNAMAAGCYLISFVAKARGRTRTGRGASLLGAGVLAVGGYLGGHLSLGRGVGVGDRAGAPSSTTLHLTDERPSAADRTTSPGTSDTTGAPPR